ncbi:MAG: glycine zipper 2TM domain-containing protein [Gammaproteobacteria bacterium]|nr:glycine zipper 2TM domain-containing protein [Gammaproteobacteria bacterium]
MNKQLVIGGVAGALAVTALAAVGGYRMRDNGNYAEVLAVEPTMKTVSTPREECHDQMVTVTRPTKDPQQIAGTVAGAVIGGVIGSKVGGGDGKKLATVGGAVGGGYAGNKVQEGMQERNTYQESQRICKTVRDSRQEQDGFDVTYRLNGQNQVVHMDHNPGKRIPVENGALVLTK